MSSNEESAALEPRVAIVVLNWNRWRLTKECLASIEHLSYSNRFVIVVDNGSTDDSVVQIQESFPETTIVRNDSNLGFAGGCNAGINRALADGAEYVFLLNNDATVEENTLRLLVGAAVRSRAAICGARVMDCEGTATQFNGRRWPMHIFGFDGVKTPGMSTGLTMTDCVDGCAMLLRRDLLKSRLRDDGYVLDPRYFLYCEDTDLCLYAKRAGFLCAVAHEAVVKHGLAQSSGGSANPRTFYYLTRNRVSLANRWLGLPLRFAFHLYYVPSRLLLLTIRAKECRSAISIGLRDGYFGVRGAWVSHGN